MSEWRQRGRIVKLRPHCGLKVTMRSLITQFREPLVMAVPACNVAPKQKPENLLVAPSVESSPCSSWKGMSTPRAKKSSLCSTTPRAKMSPMSSPRAKRSPLSTPRAKMSPKTSTPRAKGSPKIASVASKKRKFEC